jgi:hypothetical protein
MGCFEADACGCVHPNCEKHLKREYKVDAEYKLPTGVPKTRVNMTKWRSTEYYTDLLNMRLLICRSLTCLLRHSLLNMGILMCDATWSDAWGA